MLVTVPKAIAAALAAMLLAACSTLSGEDADLDASSAAALDIAEAELAELKVEMARLEADRARMANKLLELQRENERLADAGSRTAAGSTAPVSAPEAPQVALRDLDPAPAKREEARNPDALVDNPDAPDIQRSDVPVETSPRLVQPTFASTDAVFENEAETGAAEGDGLFGVHLASYRREIEAREGWRKLQRENPDELGLLEPRLERVSLPERGDFLRLIGGALSSQEKAAALCANLRGKGLFCSVSSFAGDRLSLTETGSG